MRWSIISSPIHSFVELFLFKEIIFSFSLLFYSKDESAYVLFFEMFGTRESGSKSRLIFDSHQLFLSFPLPFSQLYHGRDISIIFVSRARRTFRHDHKSCLTTWRKRIYIYIPLGSKAPWGLIRNGRWYRVENFPSNVNADENQARLMREKNAVMKGDYRENRR